MRCCRGARLLFCEGCEQVLRFPFEHYQGNIMNTKDTFRSAMNMSDTVMKAYLSDLSDADLMTRPSAGCNHLAWQLGHLISSEAMLLKGLAPDANVQLPDGFAKAHAKDQAGNDDAAAFCTKDEYLSLYDKVREASRAVLENYPEPDFDAPSAEHFRKNFPTQGDVFMLIANHPLMHAGQFAVARRNLGKPVLI